MFRLSLWSCTILLVSHSLSFPPYSYSYVSHKSPSLPSTKRFQSKDDQIDPSDTSPCTSGKMNRRRMIANAGASITAAINLTPISCRAANAKYASSTLTDPLIEVPLEFIPTLNAYVVRYNLFNEEFAAIVDTGSPFLTVPYYCKPYRTQKMRWGCYRPERTLDSGYGNTIEEFDGNYGTVVWRKADFSFSKMDDGVNEIASTNDDYQVSEWNRSNRVDTVPVVFGVLGEDLLNGSGGVFFGLIKETDRWVRPSFLVQTGYTSFCVDLRRHNSTNSVSNKSPKLILSKQPIIGGKILLTADEKNDSIPLVRDLKKRYGAPVVHYTAKASKFVVNDLPLFIDKKQPLYVIFDTGVSGMVVSQELFDGRYLQARKNREKSLWGRVEVSFKTNSGNEVALYADKPLTTPLGSSVLWNGFRGNLVVLGLAFLDGLAMSVDIDEGIIHFAD